MTGWNLLPNELRLMIIEHMLAPEILDQQDYLHPFRRTYRRSKFAAVSRELQLHVERVNFRRLRIRQTDLRDFERIMTKERRIALRSLWLCVELTPYTCADCLSEETDEQARANNVLFTQAIWDTFTILEGWTTTYQINSNSPHLTFILGAYSPGDKYHHFRDISFDRNYHLLLPDSRLVYDSPPHLWGPHIWNSGGLNYEAARLRLLGTPLEFDFTEMNGGYRNLPKLPFVRKLRVPRQFYRHFAALDIIIKSLPRLEAFEYEPWRQVTKAKEEDCEELFSRAVRALPTSVRRLSVWQGSNDSKMESVVRSEYGSIVFWWLNSGRSHLQELDLSYIIPAESFLWPFYADYSHSGYGRDPFSLQFIGLWVNLKALTMTTELLGPLRPIFPEGLNLLLMSAAAAVLRMEKLELLELWYDNYQNRRIFRYTRTPTEVLLEWRDVDDTARTLDPQVVKAWERVATKYTHGNYRVVYETIPRNNTSSRECMFQLLKRPHRIVSALSRFQISSSQWETICSRQPREMPRWWDMAEHDGQMLWK